MAEHIGQRNTWKFNFAASIVAFAAITREKYHRERIDFWKVEHENAVSELQNATVVLQRFQQTGGERVTASVDQRAAQRVAECEGKISRHTDQADTYHRWAKALEANGEALMWLDVDDVHYFGLGDPLPDDPED